MRLARQQGFIHGGRLTQDVAITGKRLPRLHTHHVPDDQTTDGHGHETACGYLPLAHVGQAVHQAIERAGRAVAGLEFKVTPAQQEKHKHGQRVEPDFMTPDAGGIERGSRTGQEGHENADRHRRIHTDPTLLQVAPGAVEKRTTGEKNHRQTQHPAGPAQQLVDVSGDFARLGDVGRPRVHHDLHGAKTRHEQAPQGLACFMQALADGQGLLHRQQPVPGAAHRTGQAGDRGLGRIPAQREPPRGCMHLRTLHTRQVLQCALDGVGAGRAIHALHHQHRFGGGATVHFTELCEFLLLDGIVEHREIVGHGEQPAVVPQPAE
ncbi:hypothetical protein FQZ97_773080 [compost metagenome]